MAPRSLKSQTTALNEVAAAYSLDGPTSKSKPKALTKTSKEQEIVKDDASDLEIMSSFGDKDDTKEHEAALSSPMRGKNSQQSTTMRFTYYSQFFLITIIDLSQG